MLTLNKCATRTKCHAVESRLLINIIHRSWRRGFESGGDQAENILFIRSLYSRDVYWTKSRRHRRRRSRSSWSPSPGSTVTMAADRRYSYWPRCWGRGARRTTRSSCKSCRRLAPCHKWCDRPRRNSADRSSPLRCHRNCDKGPVIESIRKRLYINT